MTPAEIIAKAGHPEFSDYHPETRKSLYEQAEEAVKALKAAGFAIVPREPTNSMGDAGETALIFAKTGPLTGDEIGFPSFTWRAGVLAFRAMLTAYEREGNTDV